MKKNILLYYIIFLGYLNLVNCSNQEQITIFVHGTVGIEVDLSPKTFLRLIKDTIHTTQHPKKVSLIREKLVDRGMHCINPLGITKINCSRCIRSSDIFTALYDKVDDKIHNNRTVNNHYYTFGWTGLLSYSERFRESQNLYNNIVNIVKQFYRKTKKIPKIRVIGYSHGGDVSLRLSKVNNPYNLKIDELVLIGMPVSYNTKTYLNSPMFKRVYHIYSKGDFTQRLDLFSPCSIISHKKLPFLLPNITEIELKVVARRLNPNNINLPQSLRGLSNQSPGHIELWSFGWVRKHYRKNFIFYPLPVSIFIPYIINIGKNYSGQRILLDMRPDQEIAFVKGLSCRSCKILPFLSKEFINLLKSEAYTIAKTCSFKDRIVI